MRRTNNLDSFLRRLVDQGQRPGCAALVMHRGEVIYEGAYGYADIGRKQPLKPDTILRMYSMTKPMTNVAALILLERGLFRLNDPVASYLPAFASCQVLQTLPDGSTRTRPAASPMLIRDLMCMTSGIPYEESPTANSPDLRQAMNRLRQKNRKDGLVDTQALAEAIAQVPLAFDPGSSWLYGMSHDVLGALIEVVAGCRFSEFLQAELFDPLKMPDTGFRLQAGWAERLAALYTSTAPGQFAVVGDKLFTAPDDILEMGGSGLLSTLHDYARFARMLQQGGTLEGIRILGHRTVEMMARNHLTPQQMQAFNWPALAGYGYGLGVRTMLDPAAACTNSQAGEYGWAGMAGTWFFIDPADDLIGLYGQQMIPSGEDIHAPLFMNAAGSLI